MNLELMDRESAPFSEKVWERIDDVVRRIISASGVARRILRVDGPTDLGARVGIGDDRPVETGEEEAGPVGGDPAARTHVHVPWARTLPLLHQPFRVGLRTIEAFESRGEPLDTRAIAEATRALIATEDRMVFAGLPGAGIVGLLTHESALEMEPRDWNDPAQAAEDLLGALTRLDDAGRHGPYCAALSADRWYALFRALPSGLTPFQQLAPLFEAGIVKAPELRSAALVLSRDDAGPRLVIGQDATAAFDGREGIFYRFSLLESLTVLPGAPGSIVSLRRHGVGAREYGEASRDDTLQ